MVCSSYYFIYTGPGSVSFIPRLFTQFFIVQLTSQQAVVRFWGVSEAVEPRLFQSSLILSLLSSKVIILLRCKSSLKQTLALALKDFSHNQK